MDWRKFMRTCPCCRKATLHVFKRATFGIEHAGLRAAVPSLSGWRCTACREVVLDQTSARRYAAAGRSLLEIGRSPSQAKAA